MDAFGVASEKRAGLVSPQRGTRHGFASGANTNGCGRQTRLAVATRLSIARSAVLKGRPSDPPPTRLGRTLRECLREKAGVRYRRAAIRAVLLDPPAMPRRYQGGCCRRAHLCPLVDGANESRAFHLHNWDSYSVYGLRIRLRYPEAKNRLVLRPTVRDGRILPQMVGRVTSPCPECAHPTEPRRAVRRPGRVTNFYACPVCPKKPTTGVNGQRLLVPPLWVKSERKP